MPRVMPERLKIILDDLDKQYAASQDDGFKIILENVKQLLLESDAGLHPEKIKTALVYIEQMPVKSVPSLLSFFSPQLPPTLGRDMQQSMRIGEMKLNRDLAGLLTGSHIPATPLSDSQQAMLSGIHRSMMQFYKHLWVIDYPLGEDGQVMNQAIGEWQNDLMRQNKEMQKKELTQSEQGEEVDWPAYPAYRDFARNTSILGQSRFADENTQPIAAKINEKIDELLSRVSDQENIQEYKAFIGRLGGQAVVSIVTELFTRYSFGGGWEDPNMTEIVGDWRVERGQPHFLCDVAIYLAKRQDPDTHEMSILYCREKGQVEETKNLDILGERSQSARAIEKAGGVPPHFMRISADIKLDIDKESKMAIPQVVGLKVISYTDKISPPVQLQGSTLESTQKEEKKPKI